jgi:hypothetical protein
VCLFKKLLTNKIRPKLCIKFRSIRSMLWFVPNYKSHFLLLLCTAHLGQKLFAACTHSPPFWVVDNHTKMLLRSALSRNLGGSLRWASKTTPYERWASKATPKPKTEFTKKNNNNVISLLPSSNALPPPPLPRQKIRHPSHWLTMSASCLVTDLVHAGAARNIELVEEMIDSGFTAPTRLFDQSSFAKFLWDHPTPPEGDVCFF